MRTKLSTARLLQRFFCLLIGSYALLSCKPEVAVEPPETFAEVMIAAGVPENPQPFETVDTTAAAEPQQIINDDIWACKDFTVDLSQNAADFVMYSSAIAEDVYPGNFLQGQSVAEGSPRIIPLKRGPGTITINTLNGSSKISTTVDEVSFSKIATATNDLIGINNGNLTANIAYSREEVRSLDEMGVKMNAKFSNLTTKVKGSFSYNSSQAFSSVFVQLTQVFYTIVTDIPDANTAFDASITPEDLKKYVYEGNPATYISSVSYGRIFNLLIQSTESADSIKAALDVSINAGLSSGSGGFEFSKVEKLENVSISGYAFGGDANMAAGALIGQMSDVNNFIKNGGSINNGAPISYQVRSLKDPSIKVAANLTTSYTVTECENITGGIPNFRDTRSSVGAAAFVVGNVQNKMVLFDGVNSEMVFLNSLGAVSGPFRLSEWGQANSHPFRNSGVGAAINIRHDADPEKTYFFSKDGTKFTAYSPSSNSFGGVAELWQWGTDYTCPFDSVGAAMDLSVGTREIACLFNFSGTKYTLFESGQFSPPRDISDLQFRERDAPVAIPFNSVGAALRLYITDANQNPIDRNVVAIFDGPGKQYVYFDLDKNVIVGPVGI
ncbi:MAG: thiol-activated cytolysin family protein [Bacteroidota bacterium]